jgi:dTDP-4-dehydrorhamnose 3,5-epimerase
VIFTPTPLNGAFLIELDKHQDERGFFARSFCEKEFSAYGLETRWVQMNNSFNRRRGTMRGLHFQKPPKCEVKVVRCVKGSIWDVIVDLRKGSSSFGKWFGAELNENNRTMLYVPRGFAHGFVSVSDSSEIIYMTSEYYAPEYEQTLRWDDPLLQIKWPITPKVISTKDQSARNLDDVEAVEL